MNATGTNQARPQGLLNARNTLLVGIGNNSRADDGLGWAFLDALENWPDFEGDIEYRYQLQVEDAPLIANYDSVVFIDAYQGALPEGFRWEVCQPAARFEFSTHALSPGSVLFLCQDLYQASPAAFTLAVAGDEWGLKEGLSVRAQANLQHALHSFRELIT
ncbi:MAG: hydrogenase maturation protease [Phaeodactylibacter sp.]|nr:hydrogenase maturation protease [Phaeodactylibacter sp.]